MQLLFIHENGQQYKTSTNDRGEYAVFLPVGDYQFSVLAETLPEQVYPLQESHHIKIEREQSIVHEPIILRVKERKVNIKRFGM